LDLILGTITLTYSENQQFPLNEILPIALTSFKIIQTRGM